jgi:hypothetical protein
MELPSLKINRYFGHKDPMLLIEYAFRHRPMEQVLKLIEIHDPNLEKISAFSENKKIRILSHLVPNHVPWENFSQNVLETPSLEKELDNHDSLQKFLFLHKKIFSRNLLIAIAQIKSLLNAVSKITRN